MLNKPRLLTPGPTPLPETVRLALAQDMIHHRKEPFKTIMGEVQKKLAILFGTTQPVLPLSATGTGAMTAAVYSLFSPGDQVAVIEAGKFGQRWREIAESRGLQCHSLRTEWGSAPDPREIAAFLSAHPMLRGLLMQQSETSTGALMPVREIAALTRDSGVLLIVDGISGVGISPAPMDEWGIDCLLTGSQKGLLLPPGLALIALSQRAWKIAEKIEPGCFYFNLPAEKKNIEKGQTHFTSPVSLIAGLNASLDLLLKDGLAQVYRKQWAMTSMVRDGAAAMGLEMLAKTHFAWGVTAIKMPQGIDSGKILKEIAEKYGIIMAGGQDQLKGRIIRIGHMGWVDWGDCLAALCALKETLAKPQEAFSAVDWCAAAMQAYENALDNWDQGTKEI